jgi:NitT/TauT family transport system ATP-binding protein
MPSPVASIQNVTKVFNAGKPNRVIALENIDLEIQAGEFVSLIGPSGCGKSTLLRLIGDLTSPSSGNILINGKSAQQARLDRDYGMVFQAATLYEWRNVLQNIELPLEIMRYSKDARTARAEKMLRLVELEKFGRHFPWQLSGGMQQRVSIARALAFEPKLLLMDEPFGALDEMTRERMQMEVQRIWRETGITIVFVTHGIPEAVFLSTRVVLLSPRPGRIAEIIPVDLPRERTDETREDPRFFEIANHLREKLREIERTQRS